MLEACYGPEKSPGVDAFTLLIGEAFIVGSTRRLEQAEQDLKTRRHAAWAASHKGAQESATLSDGIIANNMDREPDQASGTVSKAVGARKGLGCKSSAIRSHKRTRRAS